MKVCKFGGTSVASAEQVKKVAAIVQSDEQRRFVVVSAPGKRDATDINVTDLLIDLASFVPTNIPDVYNDDHVLTDFWKYTLTYDKGLFLRHKTYKGKRGLLKNPVTVKEDDKFITNDINEIIKFILGETATFTDTNSFETLIDFVFSNNYKYDNTVIFNVLKEYLNDKRHKDKILDIISYINKAIVNWLDDSNKELYISCLTESLLKEIIFIKNYVKN